MPERLHVNLADDVAAAMRDLAKQRGITITEAVRRAISTWKIIEETLDKGEKILVTEDGGGKARELVFVW